MTYECESNSELPEYEVRLYTITFGYVSTDRQAFNFILYLIVNTQPSDVNTRRI
jgi:hypothetical protein